MHAKRTTAHANEGDEVRLLRQQKSCGPASPSPSPPPPPPSTKLLNVPSCTTSFVKDGCRINIGDCALFQAGKTLPYVGIIRKVIIGDEEHQEEVDKLLDRTKFEMQAAVQSGASSPKALTGKPSCQQPKTSSDNVPSSALSTAKNKKRERTDQNSEPIKQERATNAEDSDLLLLKRDHSMKLDDISSSVDKDGGLFTLAGVDKLVGLMQQEQNNGHRKVTDAASRRIMLAAIIAATENEDCLNRFVQFGGLPMLDDWLQEAHKGKFGDGDSPKEGEKVLEDLLLILLHALDKLPVDLDALKTCIVGKSVNSLRSHKNHEIQKKARKLVDIWKKRVDAEMQQASDAKPGASDRVVRPSNQSQGDLLASHLGKIGVPPDVSQKNSSTFTANAKAISNGSSSSAEAMATSMVVAPVMGKTSNIYSHNGPGTKDSHLKASNCSTPAEILSVSVKEERSSCSSQSQNYGPSCSSAPLKGPVNITCKDDARNSSVASGVVFGSIAAKISDGENRLHCNAQTEASAETISDLRSSSGGKRKTEGYAKLKQVDVLSEDEKETEMAMDCVHAVGNCANSEEPYPRNGKQVVVDNSCISSVSAQKSSPEASTEADSSWKEEDSTMASHAAIENVSSAVNATTLNNDAMSLLATVAASQAVISTGSDGVPGSSAWGADQEQARFSTAASPEPFERSRNGAKNLGKSSEAVSIKLLSGKSTSDDINDSQVDGNLMHHLSCLKGKGEDTSNQQRPLNDPTTWSSMPESGGRDSEKVSVELCNGVCGEGQGPVALDNSLERCSRFGENIDSDLDGFSGRVPEETAWKRKETSSGCTGEDLNLTSHVAKEVEEEIQKYNKPASGSSSNLEMQDVKSTVFQENSDKKCVISEYFGSGHPCDGNEENPKNEEHLNDSPEKVVADSIDRGRKPDEVNVGNLLDFVPADEVQQSSVACRVDSEAIEANLSYAVQHLVSNAGKSTIKSLHSASDTAVPSAQGLPCEGSSSASVHNNLNSSARSPQTGDSSSPEQAVEKARCDDAMERPIFDLNEGLEDIVVEELAPMVTTCFSAISTTSVPSTTSNGLTAPIAVVASTRGAFIPPASPLCVNKELGWKGSAATSAFHPAEPHGIHETQLTFVRSPPADFHSGSAVKQVRTPLDIDLNVFDDQFIEDTGLSSFGSKNVSVKQSGQVVTSNEGQGSMEQLNSGYVGTRPDLDLNRADESGDGVSDIRAPDINVSSFKTGHGTSLATRNIVRDFDLNNGPTHSLEEAGHDEPVLQHVPARSSGFHVMPTASGLRFSREIANVAPWFPPGNSFSALAIPAFPGSRSDPPYPAATPQSFLNAGMCVTPFNNELYRAGAALPSTPAVALTTAPPGAYPYSTFSFGATFPLTSASLACSTATFVDAASVSLFPSFQVPTPGTVAPTFAKPPFLMSMPEGASADSNGVWGRLNLDLNAGPEPVDTDAVTASHPFIIRGQPSTEDQMRAFRQVGASGLASKRKDLEGGLEVYRRTKHTWR